MTEKLVLLDGGFFVSRMAKHWAPKGRFTRWMRKVERKKMNYAHFLNKVRRTVFQDLNYIQMRINQAGYGGGIIAGDSGTMNLYTTSFDGNTAPYLLYVIARINSIFRKAELNLSDSSLSNYFEVQSLYEIQLARKLIQFPITLNQTLSDLRPHFLSTYLFDLAGVFNTFYNNEKVIDSNPSIQQRRLSLCHRTHTVLSTGLKLLGITTVERM